MSDRPIDKPQTLRHWQRALRPLDLPAEPAVRTAAIQKLRAPSGNAGNVAAILMADPGQVLRLVHSANQSLAHADNEVKSLAHAISLLGTPRTEQILRSAPDLEASPPALRQQYRRQLSISQHAACQLQGWADHLPAWREDGLMLATLLHAAPLWALWYRAPDLMQALYQRRRATSGSNHTGVEKAVLGCSLQALAAALCRQWHLPLAAQSGWFPGERGHHRQWVMLSRIIPEQAPIALERFPDLQRLAHHRALAIALANRLAEDSDWDWYSHRVLRGQRILATCLALPVPAATSLTHRQAAVASHHHWPEVMAPAARLLGFYRRFDPGAAEARRSPADPEQEAIPADTRAAQAQQPLPDSLADLIQQLRHSPAPVGNPPQLLEHALHLLCRDVHLERACVCLLHPASRELRTLTAVGCEEAPALRRFRHRPQRGDLFNKLLQKPVSVRLQADNRARITPLLPETFRPVAAGEFFMMSLFAGSRPLGVVYADRGERRALTAAQYTLFKQLCSALSHALGEPDS